MKTVVITGSARGFGLEMMKVFRENNFNCVLVDVNKDALKSAKKELLGIKYKGEVLSYNVDITIKSDIEKMIKNSKDQSMLYFDVEKS